MEEMSTGVSCDSPAAGPDTPEGDAKTLQLFVDRRTVTANENANDRFIAPENKFLFPVTIVRIRFVSFKARLLYGGQNGRK